MKTRDGDDAIESAALEIATSNLLKGQSLKDIAKTFNCAASTLHRRLSKWLGEGRFELVDKEGRTARAHVVEIDERLGDTLARKTKIWRARVARIAGASSAIIGKYFDDPTSPEAKTAYMGADDLHWALGEVAAKLLADSLQRNTTIGLAAGRGVAFTVMQLAELAEQRPAWVSRYHDCRVVAVSGGAHVGAYAIPTYRNLDADANVFQLGQVLQVQPTNLTYLGTRLFRDSHQPQQEADYPNNLDLAVVGSGQLNARHYFFRGGDLIEPLQCIKDLQSKNPDLRSSVAEIGHRLFPVGGRELPQDFLDAIDEVNKVVIAFSAEKMKQAGDVVMVTGGAQKARSLLHLVRGECPDAPLGLTNLTLITDTWTAEYILEHIEDADVE